MKKPVVSRLTKAFGIVAGIAALAMLARADDLPADPCGQCAGPREQIHVNLISADNEENTVKNALFFVPAGERLRDKYHSKVCPTCRLQQYTALRKDAFRSIIADAARNCQQIKLLTVISHGSRGSVSLGTSKEASGFTAEDLSRTVPASLSCAFAPDATIYFDGCNIGRDCRGEGFMTMLAGRLLRKGGTIHACNYYDEAIGPIADWCPAPRALHVGDALSNPQWTEGPAPRTGTECQANIDRDLASLQKLVDQKGACQSDAAHYAGLTKDWLTPVRDLERKLGGTRTQFTADQEAEALGLDVGYREFDYALATLKKAPACDSVPTVACAGPGSSAPIGTRVENALRSLWAQARQKL